MGPPCRELQQAVCRARTKLQSLERELHHRDLALEEEEELTGALQSQNAQLKSTLLDLYKGKTSQLHARHSVFYLSWAVVVVAAAATCTWPDIQRCGGS
ncbi:unnamed protein product [Lampetra fluviatilis]